MKNKLLRYYCYYDGKYRIDHTLESEAELKVIHGLQKLSTFDCIKIKEKIKEANKVRDDNKLNYS